MKKKDSCKFSLEAATRSGIKCIFFGQGNAIYIRERSAIYIRERLLQGILESDGGDNHMYP